MAIRALQSCLWAPGYTFDMLSFIWVQWVWIHGFGCIDLDAWIWMYGFGCMDLYAWICMHGFGCTYLDAWTCVQGLACMDLDACSHTCTAST